MKKIVTFSQNSQTIAQTARERQTSERNVFADKEQTSNFSNASNNYLSLVFLSIFIFLFLGFLLFKRKSQEVRLSIFASFFLGCLLVVYTSIQISTQSLIGKQQKKEANKLDREPIASQMSPLKSGDREKNQIDTPKNKNSPEKSSKEKETKSPKISLEETERETEENKKIRNNNTLKIESGINLQKKLEENKQQDKTENNTSNISSSVTSQSPNLVQSSEQQQAKIATANQNNIVSTPRNSNFSTTHSISSAQSSRDRRVSANTRTSLFRPILKLGDRGFDVTLLQTILQELGYYTLNIDGDYGRSTEIAVQNFQQQHNLLADGIVGFSTCNILKAKSENTEIQCTSQ